MKQGQLFIWISCIWDCFSQEKWHDQLFQQESQTVYCIRSSMHSTIMGTKAGSEVVSLQSHNVHTVRVYGWSDRTKNIGLCPLCDSQSNHDCWTFQLSPITHHVDVGYDRETDSFSRWFCLSSRHQSVRSGNAWKGVNAKGQLAGTYLWYIDVSHVLQSGLLQFYRFYNQIKDPDGASAPPHPSPKHHMKRSSIHPGEFVDLKLFSLE